jgi:hypothetical protein
MKRINTRKKIVFFTAINVNVNKDTTSVSPAPTMLKKIFHRKVSKNN